MHICQVSCVCVWSTDEHEIGGHADADTGEDDTKNDGVAGDAARLPSAGAELMDELNVAESGSDRDDDAEDDESDSGPEGEAGGAEIGGDMSVGGCGGDLAEEETEAADGEADAHESEASANPGEEGSLCGEVDAGVLLDGPGFGVYLGVHAGIVRPTRFCRW